MKHTQQQIQHYYDQAKKIAGKRWGTSAICKPEEDPEVEVVTFFEGGGIYNYKRKGVGEWEDIQPL
jgi:hypothetical protein